jgi:hypothetical protein
LPDRLDLAGGGGSRLLDQMKQQAGLGHIPALALVEGGDDPGFGEARQKFDDLLGKFDREAMLRSVERLSTVLAASAANRQPAQEQQVR